MCAQAFGSSLPHFFFRYRSSSSSSTHFVSFLFFLSPSHPSFEKKLSTMNQYDATRSIEEIYRTRSSQEQLQEPSSQQRSIFRRTNSNTMTDSTVSVSATTGTAATTATTASYSSFSSNNNNNNIDERSYSIASDSSSTSSSAPLLYNPVDYINQHQQQPFDLPSSRGSSPTYRKIEPLGLRQQQPRRRSLLQHQHPQPVQIRLLRLVWFTTLILGEQGLFWMMVHRCSWPENQSWVKKDDDYHTTPSLPPCCTIQYSLLERLGLPV